MTVAAASDMWDGEMEPFDVDGTEILLVRVDGEYHAYHGTCPHQSSRLAEGDLDGTVLTCFAHGWMFDVRTGAGVNPAVARLVRHAVRTVNGRVQVSRRAVAPDRKADHGDS